ncbi:MAG: DUF484 family protein [Burkholderiaceae bacterium]
MTPDAVAQYLQHNPKFFEEYADMLSGIFVPHPHGGRAISLPERQMLTLREKVRALEHNLGELIEVGEGNDALSGKMHRLTLALLRLPKETPERIIETLNYHLREDFSIPHTAFRLWGVKSDFLGLDETLNISDELRNLAASATSPLKLPYCGPIKGYSYEGVEIGKEVAVWFGESGSHIKSLGLMWIYGGANSGGLLALASEDEKRFYPGMGTMYLERLADLVAAALAHVFPEK